MRSDRPTEDPSGPSVASSRPAGPRPGEAAFIGRARELELAVSALEDALRGRGGVLLVGGEPGIGKTRFADELEAIARARGVEVAWGRCWEAGGAPAYWPWVQSLRTLAATADGAHVAAQLATRGIDLGRWLLAEAADGRSSEIASDPDAARFRLFDDVTRFLQALAARRPLMLVLDDLHAADAPSLLLLRFVAAALGQDRILVVAAYREDDAESGSPLAETLVELGRGRNVNRMVLRGLSEADVARYVASMTDRRASASLAASLHARTEGNALFVREIVRLLLEEGLPKDASPGVTSLPMPASIREIIRRRLARVSPQARAVLLRAAVLGREFDLGALALLSDAPPLELWERLEQPLAIGLLTSVPSARERLRFSHVLIREAVHDEISPAERARLHRRAGEVIEALHPDELEAHAAELAHHYLEGAEPGEEGRAIAYTRTAGDHALAILAFEEAVRLYTAALDLERRTTLDDPALRADLLLSLGDAHWRAGDQELSEQTFLRAADVARRSGLRDRLARAALGYGGHVPWKRASGDRQLLDLLGEALAAVGPSDSDLRARLLARLAGALRDDAALEPREGLAVEAVDMARRIGDPATLGWCLEAMFGAVWRPDDLERRLEIADEIVALGERWGDLERQLSGQNYRLILHLERGDPAAMAAAVEASDRLALALRLPARSWFGEVQRTLFALMEGRFDEVEDLIDGAFSLGARAYRPDAQMHRVMHLFQLRREQGRVAEIESELREVAIALPSYPMTRAALALLYLDGGREDEARRAFDALAADDFAGIPWDNEWLFGMSLIAEIAYRIGDRARAAVIRARLLPFADRIAVGPGEGCTGSVHRAIALVSTALGLYSEALTGFEQALERNRLMGAWPWVAHTQYECARALVSRGRADDIDVARGLLGDADATCRRLGMPALGRRVSELQLALASVEPSDVDPGASAAPPPVTGPAVTRRLAFRREGEVWALGSEPAVRLRDTKGLQYLAVLIASPGREFHALDLVARPDAAANDQGRDLLAEGRVALDGGGGIDSGIDEAARDAYRLRLRELRLELDAAEGAGDASRAERARLEIDALTDELSRAYGLRGRRRSGSAAERARQSVTKAIQGALRRIEEADPRLGDHLSRSVRTGTYCSYDPDPTAIPEWAT